MRNISVKFRVTGALLVAALAGGAAMTAAPTAQATVPGVHVPHSENHSSSELNHSPSHIYDHAKSSSEWKVENFRHGDEQFRPISEFKTDETSSSFKSSPQKGRFKRIAEWMKSLPGRAWGGLHEARVAFVKWFKKVTKWGQRGKNKSSSTPSSEDQLKQWNAQLAGQSEWDSSNPEHSEYSAEHYRLEGHSLARESFDDQPEDDTLSSTHQSDTPEIKINDEAEKKTHTGTTGLKQGYTDHSVYIDTDKITKGLDKGSSANLLTPPDPAQVKK